jgi:hypothetical protein
MPEFRMDIMTLRTAEYHEAAQIAEAEAAVARQKQLIKELERRGRSTKGSQILLSLLEDALQNAKCACDDEIQKGSPLALGPGYSESIRAAQFPTIK